MQTKLTLRMERELIQSAKVFARRNGKSVSQLVADYFALLKNGAREQDQAITPLVHSLKGALRGANVGKNDYYRHLEKKYR